jgi:hypothetical protein
VEDEGVSSVSEERASVAADYPAAWKRYRVFWWMWMGAWLGFLPVEAMVGAPLAHRMQSGTPMVLVAVVCMGAFAVGGIAVSRWDCPRCGKSFHIRGLKKNLFARRCLHCGLPKRGG